jgi:KDO2-lipid IV(A) lauroyltransferase
MRRAGIYLKHRLEYYLVRFMVAVLKRLSWKWSYRVGVFLGDLAYYILWGYRDIARDNLRFVFSGKLSEVQIDRLIREVFRNIGRGAIEFIRLPLIGIHRIDDFVTIEGSEHLRRALDRGRGAILVTGHFGNWELGGAALAMKGYPVTVLAFPQANRYTDRMINDSRTQAGMRVVPTGGTSVKDAIVCLREKATLIALIDQNAYGNGVFINFFGAPASTVRGPAALALKFGCPLVPVFSLRDNGKHRVVFHEPLDPISTGDREKDIAETMAALTRIVESYVRLYPEQWFCWLHPRWQTRPPGEDEKDSPVKYRIS